jgi:hypothetical protein
VVGEVFVSLYWRPVVGNVGHAADGTPTRCPSPMDCKTVSPGLPQSELRRVITRWAAPPDVIGIGTEVPLASMPQALPAHGPFPYARVKRPLPSGLGPHRHADLPSTPVARNDVAADAHQAVISYVPEPSCGSTPV